ncbi:SPFH domain-containing protein [Bengtsoniella intestinalis]|uniref:SPFH domain-containing protein n=1 Tax=Bengtsoniella intestinalis TaxID=3073143 RepID=UPI00391F4D74
MGLIQAGVGALTSTLADQWKEYFYCDAIPLDTLVVKGQKSTSSKSSNTKGSDNVISKGSGIAVADGQCMLIVEQGRIVEVCAEPGLFTFDNSTEPSIFAGNLGESVVESFKTMARRFTMGGDVGNDQRVYYFNIKEIMDNKFGTPNPVPFRVVDANIGLDMDIAIRCNGTYSYKIMDPVLFYANVCGNVTQSYSRSQIDAQLKSEFLSGLQPGFAKLSAQGLRYSALPGCTVELSNAMNESLSQQWAKLRGLNVVSVAINSVTAPKEDEDMIKELQRTAVLRNPNMAAATLVGAQAAAMETAAGNEAGAMMGFMGLNMATQAGGMNAQNLFNMGQQPQYQQQTQQAPQPQQPIVPPTPDSWQCACGQANTSKFCHNCGQPKPAAPTGWACGCGAVNKGKFCPECGCAKPAEAPLYRCDKCGWEPADPKNPPKFCPECGDVFNDADKV